MLIAHQIARNRFFNVPEICYLADDEKNKRSNKINRRIPILTYELSSSKFGVTPNSCTFLKAGHNDILINNGAMENNKNGVTEVNEKIEALCNDHILDFLVISSLDIENYSGLIGYDGLLTRLIKPSKNNFHALKRIRNVIIGPVLGLNLSGSGGMINSLLSLLYKAYSSGLIDKVIGVSRKNNAFVLDERIEAETFSLDENIGYVKILPRTGNYTKLDSTYFNSLGIEVNIKSMGGFGSFRYVNLGSCFDEKYNEETLQNLSNINLLTIPHFGYLLPGLSEKSDPSSYFSKKLSKVASGILFNTPFGSINNDFKNIYPSSRWLKSPIFYNNNNDVHSNKFVEVKQRTKIDSKKSYFDIVASTNLPFGGQEDLQYRAISAPLTKNNLVYPSAYNSNSKQNYSNYSKSFLAKTTYSEFSSYLLIN